MMKCAVYSSNMLTKGGAGARSTWWDQLFPQTDIYFGTVSALTSLDTLPCSFTMLTRREAGATSTWWDVILFFCDIPFGTLFLTFSHEFQYSDTKVTIRSAHLSSFDFFGSHDDDPRILLPYHSPEIGDGIFKATLCSDIKFLMLPAGVYPIYLFSCLLLQLVLLTSFCQLWK